MVNELLLLCVGVLIGAAGFVTDVFTIVLLEVIDPVDMGVNPAGEFVRPRLTGRLDPVKTFLLVRIGDVSDAVSSVNSASLS